MLYGRTGKLDKQLSELKEAKNTIETETTDLNLRWTINNNIANAYLNMGKLDSALYFQQIVLPIESKIENKNYGGASNKAIGDILFRKGNFEDAKTNYLSALRLFVRNQNTFYMALTQFALADTYRKLGRVDSSLYYSKGGIANYRSLGSYVPEMEEAYTALALSFKDETRYDSAFYYLQLSKKLSDSVNDKEIKTLTSFQNIGFSEQMRLKELEAERIKTKSRTQILLLLTGLVLFSVIAFILYKSNTIKVKANLALKEKNDEIEQTLAQLKTTQVSLAARNAENE
jgi:tetratricopeptide (TPR) repeat protein